MSRRLSKLDAAGIGEDLVAALNTVRDRIAPKPLKPGEMVFDEVATEEAWATIETFCAVALRVMAHTNPSKVREHARIVEIQRLWPRPPAEKKREQEPNPSSEAGNA